MMKKIFSTLASSSLVLALSLSNAQAAHATQDGHNHAQAQHDQSRRAKVSRRHSSKMRRRSARRAQVVYACPMHPDMRSRTRGECPKCGMTLVAAPRGAKAAGAGEAGSTAEGHSNP